MKKLFAILLITLIILTSVPFISFALDAPTNATIYITTDDAYKLYVDGTLIGEDWQDPSAPDDHGWGNVESYRANLIDDFIIAVEGADLFGTIAGLSIIVSMDDGPTFDISDATWQVSTSVNEGWESYPGYELSEGWTNVTAVKPHSSWPTEDAGPWGWTENATGSKMDKLAYFKYYIPPTEEPTEGPTEPVTEAPTDPATEAPTEPVTDAPTEPATEAPTEPTTQSPTNTPDEPADEPADEEVPLAPLTVPVEVVPLAAPVVDEIVPEAVIPLDVPAVLPKTGELPATLFMGIGGLLSTIGIYLKRR